MSVTDRIMQAGYLVMGVDASVEWPKSEQTVKYRGNEVVVRPGQGTMAPSLVLKLDGSLSQLDARQFLYEFLSELVWLRRGGATEVMSTFATVPVGIGGGQCRLVSRALMQHLPEVTDPKAKLALALYREGRSVNLIPYQFLAFAKIINIVHSSGPSQITWMASTISLLSDRDARERVDELVSQGVNVPEYLYVSGRCAVAHANGTPVVNPDDPRDLVRLRADLPVIRSLAEHLIEHQFGVKSQDRIWKEHLYELAGFRSLFGTELVARIKKKESIPPAEFTIPALLCLRLQQKEVVDSFEHMSASIASCNAGIVRIRLETPDRLLQLEVVLDFDAERLTFDALNAIALLDDGSTDAIRRQMDYLRFLRSWMANGINEIWDPAAPKLLGQSEPVLLENVIPDWKRLDNELNRLEQLMQERTDANRPADGNKG